MNDRISSKIKKVEQAFQAGFSAHQAGRFEEAKGFYQSVLKSAPSDMETLYLLGTACSQTEHFEQAAAYLKKALTLRPKHVEALNNMGLTLKGQRKPVEALVFYRRALALRPDYVDALNNAGNALELLGRLDEAEAHLRRALELQPDNADAHCNLGLVMNAKDRFAEAEQCLKRGLELRPDHAISYDFLGSIYKIWGRFDEALACFDRAVALAPNSYSAHNNRGAALEEMGRLEAALADYQRAAELAPGENSARWNQAYLFLRMGMLERGWEAHELRLAEGGQVSIRFPYPEWDGGSLAGKTVLVYAEQGLGDEIMFASCISDVIAMAGHCIIECAPRLEALFKRAFPQASVIGGERMQIGWLLAQRPIDVQVAAGSLPRFLRPTLASFPDRAAYLSADATRLAHWRARVALLGPGLKVGICWRSGLLAGERKRLYSELTQWGEIFKVAGVHFVNLQYGDCGEELRAAQARFGVPITVFDEINLREEIDESAALTACMDLVISPATAVLELAGALGVDAYCLNNYGKQWVALGQDEFSPWHPRTRYIEQSTNRDWDTQLAVAAVMLQAKVDGRSDEVVYVTLENGVEVAVDAALDDLSRYVLLEQGKWFDAEFDFVQECADGARQIVDVGAGVGAYALSLARKLDAGALYAYADSAADTDLLLKSRLRNRLEARLHIAIAQSELALDAQMDQHGLDQVGLVRLAGARCGPALLAQAGRFFAANAPLVMFGIGAGELFDAAVADWFLERGYGIYRLVPGLGLLVPCGSTDEFDLYTLNLFACKPERAAQLEQRGRLVRELAELDRLPGIESPHWQRYLGTQRHAAGLIEGWCAQPTKRADWEVYWMALNLFAQAKSAARAPAERYASLQMAEAVLTTLLHEHVSLARLVSLCRITNELGKRAETVGLLNALCDLVDAGLECVLDEPVLALSESCAAAAPAPASAQWVLATVLVQREKLRAFSTIFTGAEALPALREARALGYAGGEVERAIALICARYPQLA
jgi:tetratricopeptide (TPR) repeat protein